MTLKAIVFLSLLYVATSLAFEMRPSVVRFAAHGRTTGRRCPLLGFSSHVRKEESLLPLFPSSNGSATGSRHSSPHSMMNTRRYLSTDDGTNIVDMTMVAEEERYDMAEHGMRNTTVHVEHICEFVTNDMLSTLFQTVGNSSCAPPVTFGTTSNNGTKCAFVTLSTPEEKNAAILRFTGYELNGHVVKIRSIHDLPQRTFVPERMVAANAVVGLSKTTGTKNVVRRISRDDVERLSRGRPCTKRGYGSRRVPHRLNRDEREEFDRAARRGHVTFVGTGHRRERKGSPLANIHRQWCDAREVPQIIIYKKACSDDDGSSFLLDDLIVDLSPLRIGAISPDAEIVNQILNRWNTETLSAADKCGMILKTDRSEDDTVTRNVDDSTGSGDDENDEELDSDELESGTFGMDAWNNSPIWKLPSISLGVFEGERSKAKAMAKELVLLWEMKENHVDQGNGGRTKDRRNAGARKKRRNDPEEKM